MMMTDTPNPKPSGTLQRIIAYPIAQLVIGAVIVILTAGILSALVQKIVPGHNTPIKFAGSVFVAMAIVASYKLYKRWIELVDDGELPRSGAVSELAAGLLIGGGLFALITGIVAVLGGFEVNGIRGGGEIWTMLAIAVISGTFEETLFRGIIMRHLESLIGTWGALAATSAFFGAAHLFNPDATWFAALAIALEAGILLGAAYLLTRRLWMAIGIHAAWNFTQGWVFSVPVSGGDAPFGLLITRRMGPDWLTGGAFGLEASAVAMVVATVAGLVMLRMAYLRGRFIAPVWRR
jgi:membrane protease YdiL (CAAX protease family)